MLKKGREEEREPEWWDTGKGRERDRECEAGPQIERVFKIVCPNTATTQSILLPLLLLLPLLSKSPGGPYKNNLLIKPCSVQRATVQR